MWANGSARTPWLRFSSEHTHTPLSLPRPLTGPVVVCRKLSIYDKMNDLYIHVALDNMVFIDDISKSWEIRLKHPLIGAIFTL